MCLTLYVASEAVLPLVEFIRDVPKFNVTALKDYDLAARSTIEAANVVSAGAHTGCGCGFLRDEDEDQQTSDTQADRIALQHYLEQALEAGDVDIYVCWNGDAPESWGVPMLITIDELLEREDWLEEGTHIKLLRRSA